MLILPFGKWLDNSTVVIIFQFFYFRYVYSLAAEMSPEIAQVETLIVKVFAWSRGIVAWVALCILSTASQKRGKGVRGFRMNADYFDVLPSGFYNCLARNHKSLVHKPKLVNVPEGLNQVILRKVQRFLAKKVAKTFPSTHYKLPFINANNFH